jgi:hypothetical protein
MCSSGTAHPASSQRLRTALEGKKHPVPIRHRCLVPKNIDAAVVGPELEESMLRLIPLLEQLLDAVLATFQSKANGTLIGDPPRVALDLHLHGSIIVPLRSILIE